MQNEELFPLVEAVYQATGRRPHLSTVLRWCSKGSAGVRLDCRVLGGRRLTSKQSVLRYMDQVTAAKDQDVTSPMCPPRQTDLAANRSAKKLADQLAKR